MEEHRGNGFLHFSCAIALRAGGRRHGDVLHISCSAATWISAVSESLNVMVLCIGDIDRRYSYLACAIVLRTGGCPYERCNNNIILSYPATKSRINFVSYSGEIQPR